MSMNPALSPSTLPTPNRSPIVLVLELVLGLFFTGKSDVSCGNRVGPQWGKETEYEDEFEYEYDWGTIRKWGGSRAIAESRIFFCPCV
jgi:hypothetical protein